VATSENCGLLVKNMTLSIIISHGRNSSSVMKYAERKKKDGKSMLILGENLCQGGLLVLTTVMSASLFP
jgi:hypothetical protein